VISAFQRIGAKICPFVASIRPSFYSTSANHDRAISIAEINLSKGLRRHFHRVLAPASAGPNLLDGIFLSLSKACSRSSRKNSRPQARARGPIHPAEFAHSICSAFATAFPARSQALPRTRRSGERGSKAAQQLD
jgi:hypothetical protein